LQARGRGAGREQGPWWRVFLFGRDMMVCLTYVCVAHVRGVGLFHASAIRGANVEHVPAIVHASGPRPRPWPPTLPHPWPGAATLMVRDGLRCRIALGPCEMWVGQLLVCTVPYHSHVAACRRTHASILDHTSPHHATQKAANRPTRPYCTRPHHVTPRNAANRPHTPCLHRSKSHFTTRHHMGSAPS
jgi:hypothetical protein